MFNKGDPIILLLSLIIYWCGTNNGIFCVEEFCYKDKCQDNPKRSRYLLYDINPHEGFNLCRDVYLRFSILGHHLKHSKDPLLNNFKLVLPPWSHLVHWGYSETPEYLPWGTFFDLESLRKFAPVIELYELFEILVKEKYTKLLLDEVYVLQHFEKMFETGKFEEKWQVYKCQKPSKLRLFYYTNITTSNVKCLSFHGPATKLTELLKVSKAKTILIDHAEVALHDGFGSKLYWEGRRSMRFNKELQNVAAEFRKKYLQSCDETDNTKLDEDWRNDKPKRDAKGGPYLAVHLRRKDFVRSRPNESPSLESVVKQIKNLLEKESLEKVFIATDAPSAEYIELKSKLEPYHVYRYTPDDYVLRKFKQGGIAIIDQIICSYARHFIGTSESTFSFRIQEEREILGFPVKTTFNSLCKDEKNCKKPSEWKILY